MTEKPVLPSLREKKRYLAFEIISKSGNYPFLSVKNTILAACNQFLGQLGMAKAGIMVLSDSFDKRKQKGLIKVNNKYVNELKSALTLIKKINNDEVVFKSLGVSGILIKAKKYFG